MAEATQSYDGTGRLVVSEEGTMNWIYGERVSTAKWAREEVRPILADAVYMRWESTALDSGYTPVDGTLIETVVPQWLNEEGGLTDVATPDVEPTVIVFELTGEVTPPVEQPPAEAPVAAAEPDPVPPAPEEPAP